MIGLMELLLAGLIAGGIVAIAFQRREMRRTLLRRLMAIPKPKR